MKSIWNCSLVFGDLVIPVKLYSATKQSHLEFEMVDSRDLGKIRFSRFNENTGEIVPSEFIGKAFNLDGSLVPVDPSLVSSSFPKNQTGLNSTSLFRFLPFLQSTLTGFITCFLMQRGRKIMPSSCITCNPLISAASHNLTSEI